MPTSFRVETTLDGISARDYVLERDCTAFRNLAMEHLSLRKMEFLDVDTDPSISASVQHLATRPSTGYIPSKFVVGQVKPIDIGITPLAQDWLTGDQLEFVDHIIYHPDHLPSSTDGAYQLSVRCMVPWLAKRADINVILRFEPTGQQQCRQVLEGTVAIKIPGVGRIAEPLIINGLRQAYASLPTLVTKWVTLRTEALKEGRAHILTQGVPHSVLELLGAGPPLCCAVPPIGIQDRFEPLLKPEELPTAAA